MPLVSDGDFFCHSGAKGTKAESCSGAGQVELGAEKVRTLSPKSLVPKGMADVGTLLLEAFDDYHVFQYEGRCGGWDGRKFYLLTNTCALSNYSNL